MNLTTSRLLLEFVGAEISSVVVIGSFLPDVESEVPLIFVVIGLPFEALDEALAGAIESVDGLGSTKQPHRHGLQLDSPHEIDKKKILSATAPPAAEFV